MMDYQRVLAELFREIKSLPGSGEVANYIPELAKTDPSKFGAFLLPLEGEGHGVGDWNERFSIQSISKVLALSWAFANVGEAIWERVGVEPSGSSFNSLVQLEYEKGIPRNPLINGGAMVISDILLDHFEDPRAEFLAFVRKLSACPDIAYNPTMVASEKAHGHRNMALISLMKSFGNIRHEIDKVLDFYYHICSLEMSCAQLARSFLLFANHGVLLPEKEAIISMSKSKRISAVMQTCGFYDEAGEFSFRVGLPGKSGVGGGIVAFHPGKYSVAVWSPRLNPKGNSYLGMHFLEELTTKLGLSIF